jgi:hypothetical protein
MGEYLPSKQKKDLALAWDLQGRVNSLVQASTSYKQHGSDPCQATTV